MNGDVVFDPQIISQLESYMRADVSFVAVDTSVVSDEEIKYTVNEAGFIDQLSKTVKNGVGEAVGINFVSSKDKTTLIKRLFEVDDQDYFERGMVLTIEADAVNYLPVDIGNYYAVEVDFVEDLNRANERLNAERSETA